MNNTILCSSLLALMSTQIYAVEPQAVATTQAPITAEPILEKKPQVEITANLVSTKTEPTPVPATTPVLAPEPTIATTPTPATTPVLTPEPTVTTTPVLAPEPTIATTPTPATTPVLTPEPIVATITPTTEPTINCDYKIPAEIKNVDQGLVLKWSEKAVIQSFSFDSASLDTQIQKLEPCFTEEGWKGFNMALQKSENLDTIKSEKLSIHSQLDGVILVNETKMNQWKFTVPLLVVYQNDTEKRSQLLNVDLIVMRKINGDLGIIQMIAAPRTSVTPETTPKNKQ